MIAFPVMIIPDMGGARSEGHTLGDNVTSKTVNTTILGRFIENDGQWDPSVYFEATTEFGAAAFTSDGFSYLLPTPDGRYDVVTYSFINARQVRPDGITRLPSVSNYFLGNDSGSWHTGVSEYDGITYRDLWGGISISFYFVDGKLKYEVSVDSYADADLIAIRVDGGMISVQNGDMIITTTNNTLVDGSLTAFYKDGHDAIGASFAVSNNVYSFKLAGHDASRALVIDPLVYSTYLGGNGVETGYSIAVDASGCAYVTGQTSSSFPTTLGAYRTAYVGGSNDVFVSKFSTDGSKLLYSTYLGGSGDDCSYGISVDSSGCAYVTGRTDSSNFPTLNAYQATSKGSDDAFVTKLSADGSSLAYSTYLGGSGDDCSYGISVDSSGCAYVTGQTYSLGFPAFDYKILYGGSGDAFVTKLSADGSDILYSTFIGLLGSDCGYGISIDSSGCAYVTGKTNSLLFSTIGAFQTIYGGSVDAFVTKLSADGSKLLYSTYLGGNGEDCGYGIFVDSSGCAYVTGQTSSSIFPTLNAFQSASGGSPDAFVAKLSSDGFKLAYSTYLGGSGDDCGYGITVSGGSAFVVGYTESSDFPTRDADQAAYGGLGDAFVTKLSADGSNLIYSTYLGGGGSDCGYGISVDSSGCAYVTGQTNSSNFSHAGAYQIAYGGGSEDAFVLKVNPVRPPSAPTDLTAIPGKTNVSLSWEAPASIGPGVDYYLLYQNGVKVAQVTSTSYLASGLTTGQNYEFNVSAHNAGGAGANASIAILPKIYITVQATPSAHYANASTASSITVTVNSSSSLSSIGLSSANVSHYVNGALVGNNVIAANGKAYENTAPLDLAVGINLFVYTFNDSVGNSMSTSITVTYDVVDPSLSITSPSDGLLSSTDSVLMGWTATDDRSGIKAVEYNLDGAAWITTSATGNYAWNDLADGPHTFSLRVVDYAGNMNASEVGFTVDTTRPTLTILSPTNGSCVDASSLTVEWSGIDNGSGIAFYNVSIDGQTPVRAYEASRSFSSLTNGAHVVGISALDEAGNERYAEAAFIVDLVTPMVTILSPQNDTYNNTGSVTITWKADDTISGLDSVRYSLDGAGWIETADSQAIWSNLTSGVRVFYLWATDNAGNSNITSVTIVVDLVRPTMVIDAPGNRTYNNSGSVEVRWGASDDRSGIDHIEYRLDGGAWKDAGGAGYYLWSGLSDGEHTFSLRATDGAGNENTTLVVFIVDTVKPLLTIDSPANGSYVNTGSATVSWEGSDALSGIAYYDVAIDNGALVRSSGPDHTFDDLTDGPHHIRIIATDRSGNERMAEVNVTVDTIRPSLAIISPDGGTRVNSSALTVIWSASDENGVDYILVRIDGGAWQLLGAGDRTKILSLVDGEHVIDIDVFDAAQNVQGASVIVIVDTLAPTALISPSGNDVAIVSAISASFSEAMDESSVKMYVNGIDGALSWNGNMATLVRSFDLAYGSTYNVIVSGKDLAGNEMIRSWSFATLENEGIINGTLVDSDGNPVANATVLLSNGNSTITTSNGYFEFTNVTPGTYLLIITKDNVEIGRQNVSANAGEVTILVVVSSEHGGASDDEMPIVIGVVVVVAALFIIFLTTFHRKQEEEKK
ncbi:MAG: Ig-like domain-containing protein [Methanomassiliicoccus sp.]|nr:Ig-like domain-containing protein [Methanomassiliicoccus sp.]